MSADPKYTDVFISHSAKDAARAKVVAEFLCECLCFKKYEITCTSAPGFGLKGGARFEDSLRTSIKKCRVFVTLISNESLASLFCTMEMGAAWGRAKPMKLILTPDTAPENLGKPLSSFHFFRWSQPDHWLQLVKEVVDETGEKKQHVKEWENFAKLVAEDKWPK